MNSPEERSDGHLRAAMRRAFFEQRKQHRQVGPDGLWTPTGTTLSKAAPSPEHYHVLYHVPKDDRTIPDFSRVYRTAREAYQKIFDMAQQAEPNVEYYDENGTIGIETRLHGRSDLWWVILEVAACIRSGCRRVG